ncbi:hypothetical protein M8Z33_27660 [Streptomyces sp. ZAF1911]|uniref:hypothetical protein n=1 Tax=Streptomyces sp. ZAF1911 TaxID=2944129 RepID=UPI00237AB5A2|nr:hypothetical protein [Streptomyces sp. ZAF1911]MDD9380364.1 hypothetical protein [Streptomyces sp. ZAF1911]
MDLNELFSSLGRAEAWPSGTNVETRSAPGLSALDLSYPLPCNARVITWRRSALLMLTGSQAAAYNIPQLLLDYIREWNVTRVVVVADRPFTAEALTYHSHRVVLISLDNRGEPAEFARDVDQLAQILPAVLHGDSGEEELGRIVDTFAAAEGDAVSGEEERPLLVALFDSLANTLAFLDACHPPLEAPYGKAVAGATSQSLTLATTDSPDGWRQIYLDVETLTPNLDLYRQLFRTDTQADLRAALLPLCRSLAVLRLALRSADSLVGHIQDVENALVAVRHPQVMAEAAEFLAQDLGIQETRYLHERIRRLRMDGPEIVNVLVAKAANAERAQALLAVETLGLLRATAARELLAELSADPRSAVRKAVALAVHRIESGPDRSDGETATRPSDLPTPDVSPDRVPGQRYFHGPKGTTLTVSPLGSDWSEPERMVITSHPDRTRDALIGGLDALAFATAQLLGLCELPQEQTVGMGESIHYDPVEDVFTKTELSSEVQQVEE